jgi:hypothetical protein
MTTVVIAEYESVHFTFHAAGTNQQTALAALVKTLKAHGKQFDCKRGWWSADKNWEADVRFMELPVNGIGNRDFSPVPTK